MAGLITFIAALRGLTIKQLAVDVTETRLMNTTHVHDLTPKPTAAPGRGSPVNGPRSR
jgi:hypothetical protein